MSSPFSSLFGGSNSQSSAFGANPVFGQQSTFGQTGTSALGTSGSQTSLFGQSGTPSSSESQPGVFSSQSTGSLPRPSLFSQTSDQKKETGVESGLGAGLFGKGKKESSGAELFVKVKEESSGAGLFGTNKASTSGARLFGKVKTENSGAGIFGKGKTEDSGAGIFGKRKTEDSGAGIFGKGKTEDSGAGLFGAGKGSSSGAGLFGKVKKEDTEATEARQRLFGKGKTGVGLFGKDKTESFGAGLFGKGKGTSHTLSRNVVKKEETEGKHFPENEDENPLSQTKPGSSRVIASKGLFGKPAAREDVPSAALFGKPRIARARIPSTSSNTDEKEDSRKTFRRQLSEEISSKVAIVCRNVPHKYNTAIYLKTHFKRFGEVTKVFPNQSKMQAIVHFKTHEAAAEAKRRGRILARGVLPMTIFWSNYSGTPTTPARSAKSSTDTEVKTTRSLKRTSDTDLMPKSKKPSWRDNDPVNEEIETMSGTQDVKGGLSRFKGSPEKRSRSVSPTPSTSATSIDIKPEKIVAGMFEGCVARTTSERVHLLRLRDKYLRQNRGKQKKDMVRAFVGTCPDMCPEKERYDREDKRQLSYYEIIPGTENIPGRNPQIDHQRAVKEYLRSSPDQDEPLPHELRPIPVLQKTMTYLLLEIADRGEDGRWADWFDFLWNRTRGIRKDIIQQQLNDRNAVGLIEKCARFHIYSSERLCEEDMHSFDAKINNENLTKCLQTLKEFYTDLEKKQKCFCENEAEFRAYTVLMNLNDGNILREVQQLRPEIRSSSEIKFALKAYFALNGNNYIKFFRLVKQASFTNACIMHRYFTQIRNKALTLMMRGYSMGNRSAQVPISELVRLLGFEDNEETSEFCQHYGFNVNEEEVILDRAEYIEPDTAWQPRRSKSLIESKLMKTVGELINKEPFTDTDYLNPMSSFDGESRFHSHIPLPKKGAVTNSLASTSAPSTSGVSHPEVKREPVEPRVEAGIPQTVSAAQEPAAAVVPDKPSLKKIPIECVKDLAKMLFWEVIDETCKGIGEEVKSEVDAKLLYSMDYNQSIIDCTLDTEIRSICEDTFNEAQEDKRKALQVEQELRRDRVADLLTVDIVYDLVGQEVQNLATIEMREVKAKLKQQSIERVTVDINDELVEEVMLSMVEDVAEDVFETDVRQRLKHLDDLEKLVKLSRAGRFWHKWKKEYKALTKLKRAMEEFPCAPNMQNKTEQLRLLLNVDDERIVNKKFFVNKKAKITIETPLEIEKRRQETETRALVHRLYKNLLYQSAWAPLDLSCVVGKQLKLRWSSLGDTTKSSTLYWKLLLCLPDVSSEARDQNVYGRATQSLCSWLKAKFSKGPAPESQYDVKGKVLSLYKTFLTEGSFSKIVNFGVCVRTAQGQLDTDDVAAIEEDSLYLGTSAILFVLPAGAPLSRTDPVQYDQYWKVQTSRLEAVLNVRPRYQGFPLVVAVPVSANQSISSIQIVRCLSLEKLLDEELLSDVELLTYEVDSRRPDGIDVVDPKVSEELCESLQWMARKTRPAPSLTVRYFKDVVDITLQKYYYSHVQLNLKKRKELNRLNKDPNSLLSLYNTVIAHITEVLTSDRLYKVSWPVAEFTNTHTPGIPPNHWNKGDHLEYVFSIVNSLSLPEFSMEKPDSEDWLDVKTDLWKFVHTFVGSDYSGARIKLFSRLKSLIHQLEVDFEEACNFQYGVSDCEPTFFNVPWSTVISMCVDYKLDCVDLIDPDSPDSQETKEELRVAYIKDEMDGFIVPESWKYLEPDQSILESPSLEDTIKSVAFRVQEEKSRNMTKTEISISEDPANVSVVAMETKKSSSALIHSLKSERRQSQNFMKYLEDALKGSDPEIDASIPGNSSISMFESGNKTFNVPYFDSDTTNQRRFSFDPSSFQRSFNATNYFNQTNNISAIFDQQEEGRLLLPPSRRKSDIGLHELSSLPGKKRRERLSEIYNNDPVMMYLKEPTVEEDLENLKENLKASRRDSDLFEKKLQSLLERHNVQDAFFKQ